MERREVACPLCASTARFAMTVGDRFYGVTEYEANLYRCETCASLFQDPIPDRQTVAGFYPGGYWRETVDTSIMARLQAFYIRCMLKADLMGGVERLGPAGGDWLDVGCSRGDWLALIRDAGWSVRGIEADPRAAAHARKIYGLEVDQVDGDDWRPEPETYDVLSFFHLLEHLRDPAGFLSLCHRALRPQGRILLRIPNIESWQGRVFGRAWKGLEMPRHIVLPTPEALIRLLKKKGFRIEHVTTWALRDGPPSIASSLLPSGEPTRQQIEGRSRPLVTLTYLALTWAFLPLELLAAIFGKGSMLTIIARKTN